MGGRPVNKTISLLMKTDKVICLKTRFQIETKYSVSDRLSLPDVKLVIIVL